MFRFRFLPNRFALISLFFCWFLLCSFLLRIVFLAWQFQEVSWQPGHVLRTLLTGVVFDTVAASLVLLPAIIYFALYPNRWIGKRADRIITYFFFGLTVFVFVFSFFAEVTFWEEFRSRFNFIAVDYLIYTHEVVANIQESYPLPLLIGGVLVATLLVVFVGLRRGAFSQAFHSKATGTQRIAVFSVFVLVALAGVFGLDNSDAEWSQNRYHSEISKNGVYSFFAAFRNNRMDFNEFYTTITDERAFSLVREKLSAGNVSYERSGKSIKRNIKDSLTANTKPNVVVIMVESLSAKFLTAFGNDAHITPFLDSLAGQSVFFENMYATGTRTVRGMEAVTLSIPPTPGQSIVKRPGNSNLFTIGQVFSAKGYDNNFFYGGDGYFDNMNAFFGGNGFAIYDRGRGSVLSDDIKTTRHNIEDHEVTFENAWGICDEDIYRKMLSVSDEKYAAGKPFFNFIMTTSNHRPYTYPEGKVKIPSGKNRQGAVQYTDYALRQLFKDAAQKPWFKNTVFVIVADHCASSAGKNEIDVANYHIPALVVNLPSHLNQKIKTQCSQIDLFPTLFGLLHWDYQSNFFGQDILGSRYEPHAFVATYRKLGYMKGDSIAILSDQKKQSFYHWDKENDALQPLPMDKGFLEETIAWYQTADFLFLNGGLK